MNDAVGRVEDTLDGVVRTGAEKVPEVSRDN